MVGCVGGRPATPSLETPTKSTGIEDKMSYSACDSDELLVCGKDGLPAPIVCPHRRASGAAPEKRYPRTSGPKDSQGWRAMTNMRIISTDQCLRQARLRGREVAPPPPPETART